MTNNEIIIIYKKVGTDAELKKVQNEPKAFENLLGVELEYLPYEDITIIARKNRDSLKPNIYINTEFLSIGSSIRGDVIIALKENDIFKSLTKEQAIKYVEFLKRASFNYDNFDEKGRYIPSNKNIMKKGKLIIEKSIGDNDVTNLNNTNEETLKMILGIQSVILSFIKNSTN